MLWTNRKGFPEDLKSVVKKGMKERGESNLPVQQFNSECVAGQQNCVSGSYQWRSHNECAGIEEEKGLHSNTSPQSLSLLNKHMGGVDQNDQLRGYYHVRLKCRKYYKYIFWFLLMWLS